MRSTLITFLSLSYTGLNFSIGSDFNFLISLFPVRDNVSFTGIYVDLISETLMKFESGIRGHQSGRRLAEQINNIH